MLEIKENAAFLRCVEVMARLIEKYGNEDENTTYSEKSEEDIT